MQRSRQKRQLWPLRPLAVIVLAAVIGVSLLAFSHAGTFNFGEEAESGTTAGNTGPGNTSNASGNGSIRFGDTNGGGDSSALYDAACSNAITASTAGKLSSSTIGEASSLSASRTTTNAYWTQNDHGDSARVFSINGNGKLMGTFPINGASNDDWEETDIGPGPVGGQSYLYIADTGDNTESRSSYQIYRVPEPDPTKGTSVGGVEKFTITYADGSSHNTEAMFIDQQTGEVYLIDKSSSRPAGIYKSPGMLTGSTTFAKVGELSYGSFEKVTGADMAADNKTIAIVTYDNMYLYKKPAETSAGDALMGTACKVPGYSESHGEAVSFKRDGSALLTLSDGNGTTGLPVHLYVAR